MLLVAGASPSRAQVSERPVAFDSAGTVLVLTPALVRRFALASPGWPAAGTFRVARLYAMSTGGHVLAVERESGTIDRYALSDDVVGMLRAAVGAAMTRTGAVAAARSEPARGSFVLNQMLLTWILYGPLLSSLTNDVKTGTVVYLTATGASYFITSAINRKTTVTRAQNHLATDGALRGAGAAAGTLYAFVGDAGAHGDTYAIVALAGALAGTAAGFNIGRDRSDAEATATTTISTLAALSAFGAGGALGGINETNDGRAVLGATVAAGLAGYALGPSYVRRMRYRVTLGDVQMLWTGAILGAAIGATPFIGDVDENEQVFFGSATAGLVAGALVADRVMARPFDYSTSDATQVNLGLAAGALIGGATVVLTEPSDVATGMGMVTAGALLGAFAGHKLANPSHATTRLGLLPHQPRKRTTLRFDSWSAALASVGVRGNHAFIHVRF